MRERNLEMRKKMLRLRALLAGACVLMALSGAIAVYADQVYHSERLTLSASGLDGHPELSAGHVVNIHPNGPINYAHERYMVNGAAADTTYHIVIEVHADDTCTSSDPDELPTTTLTTNKHGNGQAKFQIPPELIDDLDLHGATLHLRWSLRVDASGGPEAYGTRCTIVQLD
jgi:hypothetical protein